MESLNSAGVPAECTEVFGPGLVCCVFLGCGRLFRG